MSDGVRAELHEILVKGGRAKRYLFCSIKTISVLRNKKPKVVFVQNPSIFLCLLVLHLRWMFGFKVVLDAHWGGVEAPNGSSALQQIIDYCNRKADLVIVTNTNHFGWIESLGGRAVACPDPLPNLERYRLKSTKDQGEKSAFLICSFDVDEPFLEALQAFEILRKEGFRCVVSGNYRKVGLDPAQYPSIIFTGFAPEEQFYKILFESSVAIDLTNFENCLVCGAYEAMSAEVPLVLSDKKCLREYFNRGVVYTSNNPDSIAEAIRRAYADRHRLLEEIQIWKIEKAHENRETLKRIVETFNSVVSC
jgi:glycosyltransferase involved in cell wall biosynthesis